MYSNTWQKERKEKNNRGLCAHDKGVHEETFIPRGKKQERKKKGRIGVDEIEEKKTKRT